MIGIALGMLYSNAGEWLIHKYVLHGLGRKKGTYWSFHWHEHHRNARRENMGDSDYARPLWSWNGQAKEALGLVLMAAAHLPLARRAPWFVATVCLCHARYYYLHKRSHRDPQWARANMPWHYDHHMGPNQHANWCVTDPWFDVLMGTRDPYVGTAREAADGARKRARGTPQEAAAAPG